jgi:ribosome modulation factor
MEHLGVRDCFFVEGVEAHAAGYDKGDCPYDEGTDGEVGWLKGWAHADEPDH